MARASAHVPPPLPSIRPKRPLLRTTIRPRRYIAGHWLALIRPLLRYSVTRDAYVLRGIGSRRGPVLRADRRRRRQMPFEGTDRRGDVSTA